MAKQPKVNYWQSRQAYGCWFQGRQHILSKGPRDAPTGFNYLAARNAFDALVGIGSATEAGQDNTLRVLCEKYMLFVRRNRSPETFRLRYRRLRPFLDEGGYGNVLVKNLSHFMIYEYCEKMRNQGKIDKAHKDCSWHDGNVILFISSIRAAMGWALRSGLIPKNPVANIEIPQGHSRGREFVLTQEQHTQLLGACERRYHHGLRDLLVVLENTGARPGEITAATATSFNKDLGAIVYYGEHRRMTGEHSHKTARKGKDRTIILTGEALVLTRRLVERYPAGPLFRTYRGNPWTQKTLAKGMRALGSRTKMNKFTAYVYRHTFATRWLESEGSIDVLAELMGNTPATIRRHYSHLCGNPQGLRSKLEAFKTGQTKKGIPSAAAGAANSFPA